MMSLVTLVLAILYLCGFNVGFPLAICAITSGGINFVLNVIVKVIKYWIKEFND